MDQPMSVSYDLWNDVLYLSYGKAREAISDEAVDGVLVRRDPWSDEIVGCTVPDFRRRFEQPGTSLVLPRPGRDSEART